MVEWFDITQEIGTTVSYSHGEGCVENGASTPDTRDRLYVTRVDVGWLYFCHNCGWHGCKKINGLPPAKLREAIKSKIYSGTRSVEKIEYKHISLPKDYTTDLPADAFAWAHKYLTPEEVKRAAIGYSRSLNRVILPCYDGDDRLVMYQGRWLGEKSKKNPKYLTWTCGRDDILYFVNSTHKDICVVEDILSANVVGRSVCGCAIMGSFISQTTINYLSLYDNIYIWLDYDKKSTALKYAMRIKQLTGHTCIPIITEHDPKACGGMIHETFRCK